MEVQAPSPQTTLLILLGASAWPFMPEFQRSEAFANAARRLKAYFLNPRPFGLPVENLLDLFDSEKSADELDVAIGQFLGQRSAAMKVTGNAARDLLLYFIGHGGFVGRDSDFYLAIRRTRMDNPRASGLQVLSLADTLTNGARYLRRIIVLDCCFAAAAFSAFQAGPDQVALEKTRDAFQVGHKAVGFPTKGTTLLCSSNHKSPSLLLPDGSSTMFTKAFVDALVQGTLSQRDRLTLRDVKDAATDLLSEIRNAPKPVVHSPDQSEGDVADMPFFPNPRIEEERLRRAEEERRRQAEEERVRQAEEERRHQAEEEAKLRQAEEQARKIEEERRRKSNLEQARKAVTPIVNPNPKPPATPIPVSSVPESFHPSLPTPSPTTPANRDTVQFSSLAAPSMPSTSKPFTSPDSMIAPKPVIQTSQQKRGRLVYPALTAALQFVVQLWRQKLHPSLTTVPQLVVKAPQRGRGRLFYTALVLLVLLLMGVVGTGAYYVMGVQPFQPIRALITQANREVTSDPPRALQDLATAQKMLQAVPLNPLTDAQRTEVTPLLTATVKQAIHNYNQRAAITPLCPANAPVATINDGSTGTHAQRLAVTQAATGSALIYALGQDEKLYQLKQLNGLNSLANPVTSNLRVLDIAGDDARLAVLTRGNTTTNYFLYLVLSGKIGQPQVTDLANISAVNGESPTLVTAQGSDVYVVLASPPAATTTHAQIFDFTVNSNNSLNTSPPTRTSFSLTGNIISVAAFPNHMLFLLLADGSLVSLQVGGTGTGLTPTPVLVPSPLAAPLASSGAAFTATMPVPTPAGSAAVTSTGPVSLQVASPGDLAAEGLSVAVVGGVPHLYLADRANQRVVDLSGGPAVVAGTGGNGSKNQLFQMVQQYASSSLLGQMKGIVADAKGMVVYALTQSSPTVTSLVSIKVNGQIASSCE